jgi:hypothetical protein
VAKKPISPQQVSQLGGKKKTSDRPNSVSGNIQAAQDRPRSLSNIPSVRIKADDNRDYALVNVPKTPDGANLVLYLARTYPKGAALTDREHGSPYCEFGKIVAVQCPKEGWITISPPTASETGLPFSHIAVRTGKCLPGAPRASHASYYTHPDARLAPSSLDGSKPEITPKPDDLIRIVNIPNDAVGQEFLRELLGHYAVNDFHTYALMTDELSAYLVDDLAKANLPPGKNR